jgi:hypothetical protein
MLQVPESTVRGYVYNRRRKRVPPDTARKIVTLVLAYRKAAGPLDIWEEEPGIRPVIAWFTSPRRALVAGSVAGRAGR